jgi:hypothetical protein
MKSESYPELLGELADALCSRNRSFLSISDSRWGSVVDIHSPACPFIHFDNRDRERSDSSVVTVAVASRFAAGIMPFHPLVPGCGFFDYIRVVTGPFLFYAAGSDQNSLHWQ